MANDRETGPKYPRKTGRILETRRGARLARLLPEQPVQSRRLRPFLFDALCRFPNDISAQYQQIKKLEGIKPGKDGAGGVPDDDLRFEVGHIVEKYQRRYNPSSIFRKLPNLPPEIQKSLSNVYWENLQDCMRDAEEAVSRLRAVIKGLEKLDGDHRSLLLQRMAATTRDTSLKTFLDRLMKPTVDAMVEIQDFMRLAIGNVLPSGGSGQPKVRYVLPAAELLVLWFRLTGQPPVTTTKRVGNDFVAPSSEFIKLCLMMIEPTISMKNVATSITKAFDALDHMIENAGDHPIQTNEAFWLVLEQAVTSEEKSEK